MARLLPLWFVFLLGAGSSCAVGQVVHQTCPIDAAVPSRPLVSSHCVYLKPRRIVIVATDNRQDRLKEQDLFAHALAKHLSCGQQFAVVVSRERICQSKLPMRRGVFDETELLALSDAYRADAVLYCELNQISAYQPMQFQLTMLLVDVGEAVSLVSASFVFDASNAKTKREYAGFARLGQRPQAVDVYLHSPSMFIEFASAKLAKTLFSVWPK